MSTKRPGTGLKDTPHDERDFVLGSVYGVIDIKKVPKTDWMVAEPLVMKNQADLDFCTAYMATEISEDQEEEELGPHWQFAMIKFLMGSYEQWGADLRTAMLSLVNIGSVPVRIEQEYLLGKTYDRDWLANWTNWPEYFKTLASKYKKSSLFSVKGPYDDFDNVRAALWQHRAEKRSIACGVLWRYTWSDSPSGIIPEDATGPGEGHALKVCGQKILEGEPYLVLQNSWGDGVGDKGMFYVSRKVFNQEFARFKFFMVKDLPKDVAKVLSTYNLSINHTWWVKIALWLGNLFTRSAQQG